MNYDISYDVDGMRRFQAYILIPCTTYLLVKTIRFGGIRYAEIVVWYHILDVFQVATSFGYGAITLSSHPWGWCLKIAIIHNTTTAEVGHHLIPHESHGIGMFRSGIEFGDGRLQKGFAFIASLKNPIFSQIRKSYLRMLWSYIANECEI